MVRLASFTGDAAWRDAAEGALRAFRAAMERAPRGAAGLLIALDELVHEDGEIAIVGDPRSEATRALLRPVHRTYLPGTAIALLDPAASGSGEGPALLAGKTLIGGAPAVYVCRNFACRAPVTTTADVEAAIAGLRGGS